jgi:hypothetical protein
VGWGEGDGLVRFIRSSVDQSSSRFVYACISTENEIVRGKNIRKIGIETDVMDRGEGENKPSS